MSDGMDADLRKALDEAARQVSKWPAWRQAELWAWARQSTAYNEPTTPAAQASDGADREAAAALAAKMRDWYAEHKANIFSCQSLGNLARAHLDLIAERDRWRNNAKQNLGAERIAGQRRQDAGK